MMEAFLDVLYWLFVETLVQNTGYFAVKYLFPWNWKKKISKESTSVILVGLLVWAFILISFFWIMRTVVLHLY